MPDNTADTLRNEAGGPPESTDHEANGGQNPDQSAHEGKRMARVAAAVGLVGRLVFFGGFPIKTLPPFTIVLLRVGFAALILNALVEVLGMRLPLSGRARRARRKPNPRFKRGTVYRRAVDALRTATEPLTARDIADRMLAAAKVTNPDKAALACCRPCGIISLAACSAPTKESRRHGGWLMAN
jgi:hypothetical protein